MCGPEIAGRAHVVDHDGAPFVLFMFLDQVALMMVLIPIYQPILKIYGFDPIWFWMLFLVNATVGSITSAVWIHYVRASKVPRPMCR